MADAIRVSGPVSGTDKTLSFETGKLAQQSQGAVLASIGRTTVLATANAAKDVRPGTDFFPLTIDVEERAYAAGKVPGSFFRREGRPTEDAILTCRLTDRPLRPAFPEGFRNETQVVLTVMGADMANPHDVLSINAASASLMISGIPFDGPIGAVRIAHSQSGEWIPHPTYEEGDASTFELVVAGRQLDNGDVAIMMVEAGGTAKSFDYYAAGAPKVDEKALAGGLEACKVWIKESISLQRQLVASVIATRGPIVAMSYTPQLDYTPEVLDAVAGVVSEGVAKAITISAKADRNAATDAAAAEAIEALCGEGAPFAGREREVKEAVRSLTKKAVRKRIVDEGLRIDGRGPRDLRPLSSEVTVLPTAHGTGLFQRGETQVMNVVTMAMPRMNQLMDTLSPETHKYFLFHYNMAPWANGETGRVGSPKRREIGHGALAARALLPVLPSQDEFSYTLASGGRSAGLERFDVDGVGLLRITGPDGCGRADQGRRRRHRHGSGVRRGQVHDTHRHPRCRRCVRRHGLQGGRHLRRHHGASARHQDRRHSRRRAGCRARSGQGSPYRDPGQHERLHRPASRRGRRDGTEDHLDHHPDGQDRRGHRAEGQGHQHHPARDGCRHRRRRRRLGRNRHDRCSRGFEDGRSQGPHPGDRRPAEGRCRRDLHGQGCQRHQVRCLRQHPSRSRRSRAHLQARQGQADQQRRRRADARSRDRGGGRGDRREGQGQPDPWPLVEPVPEHRFVGDCAGGIVSVICVGRIGRIG